MLDKDNLYGFLNGTLLVHGKCSTLKEKNKDLSTTVGKDLHWTC